MADQAEIGTKGQARDLRRGSHPILGINSGSTVTAFRTFRTTDGAWHARSIDRPHLAGLVTIHTQECGCRMCAR